MHVDAIMVAYTGSQSSVVSLQPRRNTHVNNISLRFRTPKRTGLLFVASSRGLTDFIRAFLEDGLLKVETNIGGVMTVGEAILSDACRSPQPLLQRRHDTYVLAELAG